jgi:hypothetical protein
LRDNRDARTPPDLETAPFDVYSLPDQSPDAASSLDHAVNLAGSGAAALGAAQ